MTQPTATPLDWLNQNFPQLSSINPLSGGGQKQVLAASHGVHGEVVLKLLRPPVDHEATRREILAVQAIAAHNVPRVLEHGISPSSWGDVVWLIEERVPGVTLRQALGSGALAPGEVLRLARDLAAPLVNAEGARIVHRDVKPENIMRAPDGRFWLLDFGLARHLGLTSLTATALPWGKLTVGYAPPEQFRNQKKAIDSRCDIFALGVTLYESVTGANPYFAGATDQLEILRRVERQSLPRLQLGMLTSPIFEDLIAAMTQRRREHRPRSARELGDWVADICIREGI
jgi:eukaryotic-like serine/threonine-protein kinase